MGRDGMLLGTGAAPLRMTVAQDEGDVVPMVPIQRLAFLEAKREAAGLSVGEMAQRMGVTRSTIRLYTEKRRTGKMSVEFVQRWLAACGWTLRASRG